MLRFGITEVYFILQRIRRGFEKGINFRNDYEHARTGDRVVSLGEHPYFDPSSASRREALRGI